MNLDQFRLHMFLLMMGIVSTVSMSYPYKQRSFFHSHDISRVMVKLPGLILVFHQLGLSTEHHDRVSGDAPPHIVRLVFVLS